MPNTPKTTPIKHFNQTVWAMLIGGFLVRITYFMSWPFLIIILNQKLAASPASSGFLLGVSAGLSSLLGLYIGYLSDKFGRKIVMMTGCLIMATGFLGMLMAEQFWHFFVVMMCLGIGQPCVEVITKAVLGDSLDDPKAREFALHLRYFLINLAGAMGALLGLWVGLYHPSGLFISTAIIYALYMIWIAKLVNPPKIHAHSTLPNLMGVIDILRRDTLFLWLMLANFLMLIVYSQFNAALPQIISLSFADQAAKLIVLLTVINCTTIVLFQFPLLRVLSPLAVSRRTQIGVSVMLISQVLFMLIDEHSLVAWGVVFFLLSVGEAIVFPTLNVHIDQMAKPELRGSYFGAGSLSGFGTSFGAMLGGVVIGAWGNLAYFILTSIVCTLCIIIYQHIHRHQYKTLGI